MDRTDWIVAAVATTVAVAGGWVTVAVLGWTFTEFSAVFTIVGLTFAAIILGYATLLMRRWRR